MTVYNPTPNTQHPHIMKKIIAANVTYGGLTYNTRMLVEYKHTGEQYITGNKILSGIESAREHRNKGKKVKHTSGHYYIDRVAIPGIDARGERQWWYLNDYYKINKVSKYAKKIHQQLSQETAVDFNG